MTEEMHKLRFGSPTSQTEDISLSDLDYEQIAALAAIPVIIVTENQDDYPRRYVARLWDMSVPASTRYMILGDTLDEVRKPIPAEMKCLPAAREDSIVEAWL